MHKVNSPVSQERITYAALSDGTADVWIRRNEAELTETGDGESEQAGFEAEEIFFKVTASKVSKEEILADIDFWFESLSSADEGENADFLSVDEYRKAKKAELSAACQNLIYAGVDVTLSSGEEHFSLKEEDQINLFGKQAQLTTGAEKLEYHEDGNPCRYYLAADMSLIIEQAMKFKSYHTTYGNSLNMWLKGCSKASEMAAISYGVDIPEEYQSEVLKDYIAEMEDA